MTKHIMEPPPPLREAVPTLPEEVCTLVHEMLAKAPKERPSMAQVVIRLEQILALDPELSTGDWRSVHRSRMTLKRKGQARARWSWRWSALSLRPRR